MKTIDKIVWYIPFRKLRDFIRELIYTIFEIREQNNILLKAVNDNIGFIVVEFAAGFVDQLHLYRYGYSLEKLYGKKVLYDISWYNLNGKDETGKYNRNFELLNIFDDFAFKLANENEIEIAKKFFIDGHEYDGIDISDIIDNSKFLYLNTISAWRPYTKKLDFNEVFDLDKYIFPKLDNANKRVYEDIKNCKHSVACHVRRNDYLVVNYRLYSLDESYFIKAIKKINKKVKGKLKIYFFSDDMDWVKNKLIPLVKDKYDYTAVDINDNDKGYFDFYLISKCKYQIASEGRFCETAHLFNKYQNKILITPKDIDKKYIRDK